MKQSRYNVFVDYPPDSVHIAFNCVSGGMLVFDSSTIGKVKKILQSPNNKCNDGEDSIKSKLVENRFLIDDNLDELRMLKMRNSFSRFNANELAMVIAPELSCPLACPYCYVDRRRVSFSPEMVNALKLYTENRIEKASSLTVSWTGGEPLLAMDTIADLNVFFRELCDSHKKPYELHMVSNGLLLTPKVVDRLLSCGINVIQVTLDGTEKFHDRFRRTASGQGTFKTILENIVNASNRGLKILVRSNIEKSNYESVYRLIDQLAASGLNLKNSVFVPCKVSIMDNDDSRPMVVDTYNTEEFAYIEPKILLHAIKKGFKMSSNRLSTRHSFCGANTSPLLVIDAHGNILKCWCHLGKAENNMVGRLKPDGSLAYTDMGNLSKWLCWDPFDIPECKKCHVLPVCMGGCMYYNVMGQSEEIGPGCSDLKYNLEDILVLYYLSVSKTKEQLSRINKLK